MWTLKQWLSMFGIMPLFVAGDDDGGDTANDDSSNVDDRGDTVAADDDSDDASTDDSTKAADAKSDADADDDASKADDDKPADSDKKEPMLPKSRYDYQARRARVAENRASELETELEKLRKGSTGSADKDTASTDTGGINSVDDLNSRLTDFDKQIEQARADNDIEKVVELNRQARMAEHDYYNNIINERTEKVQDNARENVRLDQVVSVLEERYPALNPDNEQEYDQGTVDEVIDLKEALELKNYTPADAMLAAVGYVIGGSVEEGVAATGQDKTDDTTDDRRKKAIDKNLDTADKQPTKGGKGMDSDKGGMNKKLDVLKLSEAEFEKLPDDEKRRARGDFFE